MGLGLVIPLKWIFILGVIFIGGVLAIIEHLAPGTAGALWNGLKSLVGL